MLEGLEISIIQKSEAFDPFFCARFDPEFFNKYYTGIYRKILSKEHELLGDVAFITDGEHGNATTSETGYAKYYGARNVISGILSDNDVEFISEPHHSRLKKSALLPRDVLISCVGANIGYAAIVPDDIGIANIVRNVALIRAISSEFINEYLHAYLCSSYGKSLYIRMNTGNAQPLVSLDYIKTVPVYKPSLVFQNKIRSLTNLSLDALNNTKTIYASAESLLLSALSLTTYIPTKINTNIKSLKESFLASGRLDAEYYQPKFDEIEGLIKTSGVYFKRIEEIQTYNSRGMSAIYDEAGTIDMITQKHILETGLDYDNFDKTDFTYFTDNEPSFVAENDILIYGTGANIGRAQPYLSEKKAVACQDIIILRVVEDPVYVAFVINSFIGRLQTDKMRTGSAQPHLYPKDIAQFLIPFIDKETQLKIRDKIISSLALKKQSTALLNVAKRAVEIAIEQDEKSALTYLTQAQIS